MMMLIDNQEYDTDTMPVEALTQISLVQFIDAQIQSLKDQRNAHFEALKSALVPQNQTPFVLFDIGANFGTDSLNRTRDNHNVRTWAFEPTPELIGFLSENSQDFSDRYNIVPMALSDFDGKAVFNVADTPGCDWGCSSLNTFSDGLEQTWPGRGDLKFNRSIDVDVGRLDTWFETQKPDIQAIDFFHCDTQGSDLKVLQGMGDYIHLIKAGEVECAASDQVKLYKENHTFREMSAFLESKGFEITAVTPNDIHHNEVNVAFRRLHAA